MGGFKPGNHSDPFIGNIGIRHESLESKIEIISPFWLQNQIISAVKAIHPYEEVAYEINALKNEYNEIGAGLIGDLSESMTEIEFLNHLKSKFHLKVIKHTRLLNKKIKKVAVCGGSGSSLINQAKSLGADIFVTSDIKYHDFFDADDQLILTDIGHYESEQFTIDLFDDILKEKFPNFAILKTNINTNPVEFYL
jgi:putative NIF3 family GTP cyclohydrolase 1 type 2